MIFGIGTDILEVSRIRKVMGEDIGFREHIFTEGEIAYCEKLKNKFQNYAARFAAKEAFMKALGTGWRFGIRFADVEVQQNELGKPFIRLHGIAKKLADERKIAAIHVSLSHTKEFALATVVLDL
jgi:holo-[acyl-carrier protein] synthase